MTEDSFDDFIAVKRRYKESPGTADSYRNTLNTISEFLGNPENYKHVCVVDSPLEPCDMTPALAGAFWEWYTDNPRFQRSTRNTRFTVINDFYNYMTDYGQYPDESPFKEVIAQADTSTGCGTERREISLTEMRSFLATIGHISDLTAMVLLATTGIRAGELCNLDLRDVHIDYPNIRTETKKPRGAIAGNPDTLFIPGKENHDVIEGREYNGEVRVDSNKRKKSTKIPLSPELKYILTLWLAARPETPFTNALFVKLDQGYGHRLTSGALRNRVRRHAEPYGWHEEGGGAESNVTPHYFRHFFSTHFSDRCGDPYVTKAIRGDVGDDILDTYRHSWNGKVKKSYLSNIYTLLDDHPFYGI